MDDNDFANMFKKAQEMINNNQVPDELKSLVNNMKKEQSNNQNHNFYKTNPYPNTAHRNSSNNSSHRNNNSPYQNNSNNSANNNLNQNKDSNSGKMNFDMNKLGELLKNMQVGSQENSNSEQSDFPNIDMETMLKLQNIMSKLKSNNSNDDMSKLLLSLKPYLRNEKKEKVDEYIKLIKMGKITQLFDSFGGDKK